MEEIGDADGKAEEDTYHSSPVNQSISDGAIPIPRGAVAMYCCLPLPINT